jgi:hypothetical protein
VGLGRQPDGAARLRQPVLEQDRQGPGLASVRSLGWNLGTFRELGGAVVDPITATAKWRAVQRPELTHRMAYAIALPATVGTLGAIYQYLRPGSGRRSSRITSSRRRARPTSKGEPERVSLPSYMKDVYAYSHNPGQTWRTSCTRSISTVADMLQNEDYYGTKIRNEDDPVDEAGAGPR